MEVLEAAKSAQLIDGPANPLGLVFLNTEGRPLDQKYIDKTAHTRCHAHDKRTREQDGLWNPVEIAPGLNTERLRIWPMIDVAACPRAEAIQADRRP